MCARVRVWLYVRVCLWVRVFGLVVNIQLYNTMAFCICLCIDRHIYCVFISVRLKLWGLAVRLQRSRDGRVHTHPWCTAGTSASRRSRRCRSRSATARAWRNCASATSRLRVAVPLLGCCACEPAPAPGRATGCAAAGCGLPSRACKREQAAGADRGAHSDGLKPLGGRARAGPRPTPSSRRCRRRSTGPT